jgi:hypothetical protein
MPTMLVVNKGFFCGRKRKFGMNCQAVSDLRGQILDFLIGLPGASLDCIAFEGSSLYERLEGGARQGRRIDVIANNNLPRTILLNHVVDSHKMCPHTNMRTKKKSKPLKTTY